MYVFVEKLKGDMKASEIWCESWQSLVMETKISETDLLVVKRK